MTMLVKKAFISSEFIPSVSLCPLPWAFLFSGVLQKENFPIKQERVLLARLSRRARLLLQHILCVRVRILTRSVFFIA